MKAPTVLNAFYVSKTKFKTKFKKQMNKTYVIALVNMSTIPPDCDFLEMKQTQGNPHVL